MAAAGIPVCDNGERSKHKALFTFVWEYWGNTCMQIGPLTYARSAEIHSGLNGSLRVFQTRILHVELSVYVEKGWGAMIDWGGIEIRLFSLSFFYQSPSKILGKFLIPT